MSKSSVTFNGTWGAPPITKKPLPEESAAQTGPSDRPSDMGDILQTFGENTTAHGVGMIARSRFGAARLLWLAVFLAMLGLFCWQGSEVIIEYATFPSTTKVKLITNANLTFPSITICNMNRFKRSQIAATRFDGLIHLDGGLTGDDGDTYYSWWFDWDTEWYDQYVEAYGDPDSTDPVASGYQNGSSNATDGAGVTSTIEGETETGDSEGTAPPTSSVPSRRRKRSAETSDEDLETLAEELGSWVAQEWNDGGESGEERFEFEFEEDFDWGNLTDANTWEEFYARSKSPDYSDFISIINPTKQELKAYGHQAKDLILQCTYNKKFCSYKDFFQFQNNEYGNCYTFNHIFGPMVLNDTKNSGAQYGLHLTLFLEMPEYVGILSPEAGVRVAVHSPSTPPFPEDDGITIAPGMATNIGIRQVYVERLQKPYNDEDCAPFSRDTYSRKSCHKLCVQKIMYEKCHCVSDILLENKTKCSYTNKTQEKCKQLIEFLGEERKLECNCPIACNETTYSKTVSSSNWPSERYEEHLRKRLNENDENDFAAKIAGSEEGTSKNLVRLRVYFEELNYQSIKESALYTFPNLLGNVGGLLGLYIGVSFLTLAEVASLIVDILKFALRKTFCKNKVTPGVVA